MLWQPSFVGEPSAAPTTAREAAKIFLHDFVLLDWAAKQIPTCARGDTVDVQIGGVVEDGEGRQQELRPDQIAVTRLQDEPCLVVFFLAELIVEIRREVGKEPEEDAPRCLYCGAKLDNAPAGRTRQFCDNKGKCKQAHHRQQKRKTERAALLQKHKDLCDDWQVHQIGGELLSVLQDMLFEKGEAAARAATHAILAYVHQERDPQPPQQPPAHQRHKT